MGFAGSLLDGNSPSLLNNLTYFEADNWRYNLMGTASSRQLNEASREPIQYKCAVLGFRYLGYSSGFSFDRKDLSLLYFHALGFGLSD